MPRGFVYSVQLRQAQDYYLITDQVFALSDCNDKGALIKKYVIVEVLCDGNKTVYVCSCDKQLRNSTMTALDDGTFTESNCPAHCVHITEAVKIFPVRETESEPCSVSPAQGRITA